MDVEAGRTQRQVLHDSLASVCEAVVKKKAEIVLPSEETILEWELSISETTREIDIISNHLVGVIPKTELQQEFVWIEKTNAMRRKAVAILTVWRRKLEPPLRTTTEPRSPRTDPSTQFRLPKIDIKPFGGDVRDWSRFWDQFRQCIHENAALSNVNKMVHLNGLLVGTAHNAIAGLPLSDNNYPLAIELLKNRFGDKSIASHDHLRAITALRPVERADDVRASRKLLDVIACHLSALDNLDVPLGTYAMSLYSCLIRVIPSDVVLEFERRNRDKEDHAAETDEDEEVEVRSVSSKMSSIGETRGKECRALMSFFKKEVETREKFALARGVAGGDRGEDSKPRFERSSRGRGGHFSTDRGRERNITGAVLRNTVSRSTCIFCSKEHDSQSCSTLMPSSERVEIVKKSGRCFRCLGFGHRSKDCRKRVDCDKCHNRHLTIMHNETDSNTKTKAQPIIPQANTNNTQTRAMVQSEASSSESQKINARSAVSGSVNKFPNVILQTATGQVVGVNIERQARMLFDTGSQLTFISSSLARELELSPVDEVTIDIFPFGVQTPLVKKCSVVVLPIRSKISEEIIEVRALEIDDLGCTVQTLAPPDVLEEVSRRKLQLADDYLCSTELVARPPEVEILIGGDWYNAFTTGRRENLTENLAAIETKLNWTLMGPVAISSATVSYVRVLSACVDRVVDTTVDTVREEHPVETILEPPKTELDCLWSLEKIGIESPSPSCRSMSARDQAAVEHFDNTVEKVGDRYQVRLPWNEISVNALGSNYGNAVGRMQSVLKRMTRECSLDRYRAEVDRYLLEDHAEVVVESVASADQTPQRYYMPHHPVFREDKDTTKMRVVFDCSSSEKGTASLNDLLLSGPNKNPDLSGVLIEFRRHPVALMADIKQAFLQVLVHPDDRDFLRYLWTESNNTSLYRMKVLPFGLTCSPFLLSSVIHRHLEDYREKFPAAYAALSGNLYVDDLLAGAVTAGDALQLQQDVTHVMAEAGMELRKWTSNKSKLRAHFSREKIGCENEEFRDGLFKVLGLSWDVTQDELVMCSQLTVLSLDIAITKRNILRIMASVYDPLGFLAPFITRAKCLLRRLWLEECSWDELVVGAVADEWSKWCKEVDVLSEIRVPRQYAAGVTDDVGSQQLHIFCDSSEKAYAAVAYLRTEGSPGSAAVNLVMSKCRVAPVERVTIPRLELLGAVIAVRLRKHLNNVAPFTADFQTFFWSDSMVALSWVRGVSGQWQTFVANRVEEIQRCSAPIEWHHCPGVENPADLPTRGLSTQKLRDSSLWWHGPRWLCQDASAWPGDALGEKTLSHQEEVERERKRCASVRVAAVQEQIVDPGRFSSFSRMIRVVAFLFRFADRCKAKRNGTALPAGPLETTELLKARLYIIRQAQREGLSKEIVALENEQELPSNSPLRNYAPFIDDDGIVRISGRLQHASSLTPEQRSPIVLPPNNEIVALLIKWEHRRLAHAGTTTVLSHLRDSYWIIRGRQQIKALLNKCSFCKRFSGAHGCQVVAPLPSDRVTESHPFEIVGIDFAGPLYVKTAGGQEKAYICLITCAVSRAVHLELVPSLSTGSFLLAFRRFVARRGVPQTVYTDNALTFQRANLDLILLWKAIKDKATAEYFAEHSICWKFIVPHAPNWGGFYERLVRTVKSSLRKVLGKSRLNFETLSTVLAEVEAIVNSRPLTQVSDDPLEQQVLTPSHLLIGERLTKLPPGDTKSEAAVSDKAELKHRWDRRKAIVAEFWKRWKHEYLLLLKSANQCSRVKNPIVPKIGDVVIIKDDNRPRILWKTGVVTNQFKGRDGLIRSIQLRLPSGTLLKRAVQSVCPLEVV